MESKIEKKGKYERFKTDDDHEVLVLNDDNYFAIVKGQKGKILVKSGSGHTKDKSISKGQFYLVNVEDDPKFNDVPHLFLENKDGKFDEWVLPNNLPTDDDTKKKLIQTDKELSKDKVEKYIKKID